MPAIKVEISMGAKALLENAGLREYGDFLKPPQAKVISEVRDRIVYFIPTQSPGQAGMYLKVFQNKGANHPLWQLLSLESPHSLAEAEARRLRWLEEHDYAAPRVLAWGARMSGPWEQDSFLITEELAWQQALDEWLTKALQSLGRHSLKATKRTLLAHCAQTLAHLHQAGFDHPSPYLRHFFVPAGYGTTSSNDESPPTIAVIDVHTARIGKSVSLSNRQRALAETLLSSFKSPVSQTDRLFFLKEYCGGKVDRRLLMGILTRLKTSLRRHPNRYRWVREAVSAIPFPASFKNCSGD